MGERGQGSGLHLLGFGWDGRGRQLTEPPHQSHETENSASQTVTENRGDGSSCDMHVCRLGVRREKWVPRPLGKQHVAQSSGSGPCGQRPDALVPPSCLLTWCSARVFLVTHETDTTEGGRTDSQLHTESCCISKMIQKLQSKELLVLVLHF